MRCFIIILCLLSLTACASRQSVDIADRDQFRRELKAALLDDPELVLDLLHEHDIETYDIVTQGAEHKRQREQAEILAKELANPLQPVMDPARPVRGAHDAPVTIVSYSDFLCSWCSRGAQTMEALLERYTGLVCLVYKHNPRSEQSAMAALYYEALGEQDPALAFALHDRLFADQQALAEKGAEHLQALAAELGADMDRLSTDLEREDITARIAKDEQEAEGFGFSGTPMFVVGGVSVRGAKPLDDFDQIVRLVLERRSAQ